MSTKIFRLPKRFIKRLIRRSMIDRMRALYDQKDYLEAYSRHTDIRVERDPHSAVGGMWEQIGQLQFDFLVNHGLEPNHKLLDIGCGTLRGGRHFITYLVPGNYTGFDISSKAIEYAKQLVQEENLLHKYPRLLVNENRDLKFKEFEGETFDYVLAQSVFTHLKPQHIEECFRYIGKVMKESSVFFFTFHKASRFRKSGVKRFSYPSSFFENLAEQYGFEVDDCSGDYNHPKGQRMVQMTKKRE